MLARVRFFGRFGNIGVAVVVCMLALVGIIEGDFAAPLFSGAVLAAIALSVHATERMAFLESKEEWRKAEDREVELHQEAARFAPRV